LREELTIFLYGQYIIEIDGSWLSIFEADGVVHKKYSAVPKVMQQRGSK